MLGTRTQHHLLKLAAVFNFKYYPVDPLYDPQTFSGKQKIAKQSGNLSRCISFIIQKSLVPIWLIGYQLFYLSAPGETDKNPQESCLR